MSRLFIYLTGAIFFFYGLLFIFLPESALQFLVRGPIDVNLLLTDIRATYGGMSTAVGLVLLTMGRQQTTHRLGLLSILLLMSGMALGRTVGIVVDGEPNHIMLLYLGLEVLAAMFALLLLRKQTSA